MACFVITKQTDGIDFPGWRRLLHR
jgi:hypothetical protein